MNKLLWFNKEGDALNLNYDNTTGIYSGTLNFDENSSDTFKSIGLYLFESVDSITFDAISGDTNLQKFQLFNENRFTFTGNIYFTQSITDIQPINNHSDFYSKWIFGDNFETKYPVGSSIVFNSSIFEFSNPNITYTVLETKKNAILIITPTDNKTFTNLYSGQTFSNRTISGINSIGVYDYKRGVIDQLSDWNEPDFYTKIYDNKKINVIHGSGSINYLVTVKNNDLVDRTYFKYNIDLVSYTASKDLNVNLSIKTDLPNIYTGPLNISNSLLYFGNPVPAILLPGRQFIINNSTLNSYAITVGTIPLFSGNINTTYYATQSHVMWNNIIYESLLGYTQTATSSINPNNGLYWTSSITYLASQDTLNDENLLDATLHLTTNNFTFTQTYTNSNVVTMASFAQNYAADFKLFNINLYYKNGGLNSDLIYDSKYAIVDYLSGTNSITNTDLIIENIFQTKEILKPAINVNDSSNFGCSMVITDIDNFGIKITINGIVYQESVDFIFNGLNVDLRKSIDRTLRNFLFNNFARLTSIGINVILESNLYTSEFDFFKDTITFTTQYPNVPFKIAAQMGSLASYYIKHSKVDFQDIGNYINITINGKDYGQKVISSTPSIFIPDIPTTISNWVSSYKNTLFGYGILVSNIRGTLYFNISEPTTRLSYSIRTAKLGTPGIDQYIITNYLTGNFGILLSGNQIVLSATSSQNFETSGFATGMITSINNTVYPYNNQEYNVLHLDSNQLGLSYQGPFWSTLSTPCNLSGYTILAFSPLAFGVTACPIIGLSGGGEFSYMEFDAGFSITYNLGDIFSEVLLKGLTINNTNLNDILFINEFGNIYVAGDNISIIDAKTLKLLGHVTNIYSNITKIIYNTFNKYIYALSPGSSKILIIDPTTNSVYTTINSNATDIIINQFNGDLYASNGVSVYISKYNTFVIDYTLTITSAGKMEYNFLDNNIYVVGDKLYVINHLSRMVETSYVIGSLNDNYIFTEPIYGSMYVWGGILYNVLDGGATVSLSISDTGGFNKLIYDNLTGDLFLTQNNANFTRITSTEGIVYTKLLDYGDIVVSQFDSYIYMVNSAGKLYIIDPNTGNVKYTTMVGFSAKRIIYNPLRESVIVMGANTQLIEIKVNLMTTISLSPNEFSPSSISDGLFGTLNPNYVPKEDIWFKTRQYIRGPRANFSDDDQVQIVYKFVDDQTPQIFMYDTSGSQLSSGTSYSYTGLTPLPTAYLNKTPNLDITKISDSTAQQTIFEEIITNLDYIDSNTDISILPTPVELFLGYNDIDEGYVSSTLKMYFREAVSLTISYNQSLSNDISFMDMGTSSNHPNGYGIIQMNSMSSQSFLYENDVKTGLKSGQLIQIFLTDVSNSKNKYISYNNGNKFNLVEIYNTQMVVEYINYGGYTASISDESTIIIDSNTGLTTHLKFAVNVLDKEIASIKLFGQTEIEDIRYKIELYNSGGHNINPQDAYIFKTYDIEEQGIDWTLLNKKRKEMLIVRSEIFPYVGSYKAIVNAINYFGYNDLILNEYYRNIDINSPNFYKLFKVEIPDIFDNTVAGFTIDDFLKHTMPNPNFEETNLFNLTYLITDKQGNNVLLYSLQEVIIKLQGLKNWLETNVIPITHKILDISGRADFVAGNYIKHKSYSRKGYKISETMTPVDFQINEAYLMPVNSGSTVYNVVLDFVSSKNGILPSSFTTLIRTYKTFQEWNPFTIYNIGDEVIYYGIIYKTLVDTNKLLDPRKYANISSWNLNVEYFDGQLANYNRHIYEYLGTQSSFIQFGTSSVPTPAQTTSWLDISEWVIQDLAPVQTINEYRLVGSVTYSTPISRVLFYTSSVVEPDYLKLGSFNFSIDSNIDPFITVEVNCSNGYGLNYTSKKNYEIRGTSDLYAGQTSIEPIGPFIPITPVI